MAKKSTITVVANVNGYETTKTYEGRGVAFVIEDPDSDYTWFGFETFKGTKLEGAIHRGLVVSVDFG